MSGQWGNQSWNSRDPGPKDGHWQSDSRPSGSGPSDRWEQTDSWDQGWDADDDWNQKQHQEWQRQTWEDDSKEDWARAPWWPQHAVGVPLEAYGAQLTHGAQLRPRDRYGPAQGSAESAASDEGSVTKKAPKSKKKKRAPTNPQKLKRRPIRTTSGSLAELEF